MSLSKIKCVINAVETREGGGFVVRRPFPTQQLSEWDPFLLIDELGPIHWAPNEAIGAPAHPHRGFETITYILQGHTTHRDSMGNSGELKSGDLQWMTAGSGIVHEELPHPDFKRTGGVMHGFQIWLNLPPEQKMISPQYQKLSAEEASVINLPNNAGSIKVIAGQIDSTQGPIQTVMPIQFADITLLSGGQYQINVPIHSRPLLYVYSGTANSQEHHAQSGQLMVFDYGTQINLSNPEDVPMRALFLSGPSTDAPIARYGPFVMNTHDELIEAFADYQAGRMGHL